MNQKLLNYMTPTCAARLQTELNETLYHLRPKMVMTLAWAASADHGDNDDYRYAKRVLHDYNSRIRYLKTRLASAEVIDPAAQSKIASGRALFGAEVTYQDGDGQERSVHLLGVDDHDLAHNIVSCTSHLGRSLLAKRAGDRVAIDTPNGTSVLTIIKVIYPPLH